MKKLFVLLTILISIVAIAQTPCPIEGVGKTAKAHNNLKNRDTILGHIDTRIKLNHILNYGEDSKRFSQDSTIVVYGYCVEYCNWGSIADSLHDIHLYIGTTTITPKSECMVVVITPTFRALNKGFNVNDYVGHIVKVYGPLFYDKEHKENAKNTCIKCSNVWRKTCWEIHPVVQIDFIK